MARTSLARSATGLARYYLDCGWWRHRHYRSLPLDALGLWVCIVGACNEQATDGRVPADPEDLAAMVGLRLSRVRRPLTALIDAGRLAVDGDDLVVVGFADHNPTSGEIDDYTRDRSRQGARGNHVRWHEGRGVTDPDCDYCPRSASDPPTSSPPDRYSDRYSDPPGIAPGNPEGIASSSHGMGWDGMGTTRVSSPTGRDPEPTNDDERSEAEEPLPRSIARARAARIGKPDPTPSWLTAVALSLDHPRLTALHTAGVTDPAELEQLLDQPPTMDELAGRRPATATSRPDPVPRCPRRCGGTVQAHDPDCIDHPTGNTT